MISVVTTIKIMVLVMKTDKMTNLVMVMEQYDDEEEESETNQNCDENDYDDTDDMIL